MAKHHGTPHDLYSGQGALPGERPGRAKNPLIKVLDLAWLESYKPDLGLGTLIFVVLVIGGVR